MYVTWLLFSVMSSGKPSLCFTASSLCWKHRDEKWCCYFFCSRKPNEDLEMSEKYWLPETWVINSSKHWTTAQSLNEKFDVSNCFLFLNSSYFSPNFKWERSFSRSTLNLASGGHVWPPWQMMHGVTSFNYWWVSSVSARERTIRGFQTVNTVEFGHMLL